MNKLFFFIIILQSCFCFSQEFQQREYFAVHKNYAIYKGDTINKRDENGLKNGKWLKIKIDSLKYFVVMANMGDHDTTFFESEETYKCYGDTLCIYEEFYVSGECYYHHGVPANICHGFHKDGTIRYKATFKNGVLKKIVFYSEYKKDKKQFVISYRNGKYIGTFKAVSRPNKVLTEEEIKMLLNSD